uniref:Putative ovule protein n=2 Tax=Solanum TaxID=4107 RepID=A0A0V0HR06_SOLCH
MGMSKTEVNLKRLLVTAPQQQNQAKLIHYVATLRELLEQLAEERNPDGLPRISKAKVNEYAENIEAVAAKLAVPTSDVHTPKEPEGEISSSGTPKAEGSVNSASEGLRRRFGVHSNNEEKSRDTIDSDQSSAAVKLDDAARTHIEKHR